MQLTMMKLKISIRESEVGFCNFIVCNKEERDVNL